VDEVALINQIEELEATIAQATSKDQQRFLLMTIMRLRNALDAIYDREYLLQLERNPELRGKIYPQLSGTGRS
jgi:hypothetical protein